MIHSLSLSTRSHYRLSVSVFYFIPGLIFASWAGRIPDIRSALRLSEGELGSVLLCIPLGQMAAMALSGFLVSRFGSRKMMIAATILYPTILVFLGMISTVWELCSILFFFGMAANLSNISVNTQGVGVEKLYKQSIMATFHGLWSLAGFLGGLISAYAVALNTTPLVHFATVWVISMILLLSMYQSLLPRDPDTRKEKAPTFIKPDGYIITLGLISFGCMACEGTMYDWSSVYFEDIIQPPRDYIRSGYIASMCAMTFGRFIADRLITRFGAVRLIQCSGLIIACGLFMAVLMPSLLPATLGFLLVGLGVSSVVPICYSLAGKSRTMLPGVALATVSTIGFLGFLLGPPIIGYVAQALDLRWSLGMVGIIGILTGLIASRLNRQ